MASILDSKAKYYRCDPRESSEAGHLIESEADIFIKELSLKQLRTSTTLDEQLKQKKEFYVSHSYQPITEHTCGALSYDKFKEVSAAIERCDESVTSFDEKESRNVSRHMRELALAVKPNSAETKLLEFAIACNAVGQVKPDNRPEDHPINDLHNLENELFGHLNETADPEKTAKTILRKRKQLLEATSDPIEIKSKSNSGKGKSLWDVEELIPSMKKRSCRKLHTCQREKLFTIRGGKIVALDDNESLTVESDSPDQQKLTAENSSVQTESGSLARISEEDIRKLLKFQNYQRGGPAKTLYLKNLSPRVTEEDLSTWFAEFQRPDQPRIVFNLMKSGKMRGQAFVHFHCVKTAAEALEKLNGCIMHGKPLIIQFSSSQR